MHMHYCVLYVLFVFYRSVLLFLFHIAYINAHEIANQ